MKILFNPSSSTKVKIVSEGINIKPLQEYTIPYSDEERFSTNSEIIGYIQSGALQVSDGTTTYTNVTQGQVFFQDTFGGRAVSGSSGGTLSYFDNVVVTDSPTGTVMTSYFYDLMSVQRELFNATSNPLYDAG